MKPKFGWLPAAPLLMLGAGCMMTPDRPQLTCTDCITRAGKYPHVLVTDMKLLIDRESYDVQKLHVVVGPEQYYDALVGPNSNWTVAAGTTMLKLTSGWMFIHKRFNDYSTGSGPAPATGTGLIVWPIIITNHVTAGATGSRFIVEVEALPDDGDAATLDTVDRVYFQDGARAQVKQLVSPGKITELNVDDEDFAEANPSGLSDAKRRSDPGNSTRYTFAKFAANLAAAAGL